MEKRILALLFISHIILVVSCKEISKQQIISNKLWNNTIQNNMNFQDSILLISEYKKTTQFEFYWAKFRKRPVDVLENKKYGIRRIDQNSIYFNKTGKYTDYIQFVSENKITLKKMVSLDDSFDGYFFVFSNTKENLYKLFKTTDFFELLHEYTNMHKELYLNGEDTLFDSFVNSIWNK